MTSPVSPYHSLRMAATSPSERTVTPQMVITPVRREYTNGIPAPPVGCNWVPIWMGKLRGITTVFLPHSLKMAT